MCEMIAVVGNTPLTLGALFSWAIDVERLGIAGYGWGVAWMREEGRLRCYRNATSMVADTEGRSRLTDLSFTRALVLLRRPSRLSTIQLADTQPFLDTHRRFAFVHNGTFERAAEHRKAFGKRLRGTADSEVGFCLLASLLDGMTPPQALALVHQTLGGSANLGYISREGHVVLYGGHPDNALHRFCLGDLWVACTNLHSDDDSLFRLVFPKATKRQVIGHTALALNPR